MLLIKHVFFLSTSHIKVLWFSFSFKNPPWNNEEHIYERGKLCFFFHWTYVCERDMDQKYGCLNVRKQLQIICDIWYIHCTYNHYRSSMLNQNWNGCKPFYILTICVHFDDFFGMQQFKMFLKKIYVTQKS
jgi:hypothetical protein